MGRVLTSKFTPVRRACSNFVCLTTVTTLAIGLGLATTIASTWMTAINVGATFSTMRARRRAPRQPTLPVDDSWALKRRRITMFTLISCGSSGGGSRPNRQASLLALGSVCLAGAVEFPFDWASGSTAVVAAAILGVVGGAVLIFTLMRYRAWRRRRAVAASSGATRCGRRQRRA